MDPDLKSLLSNVLGGVLASAVTFVYVAARHLLSAFHLQRLLGLRFRDGTEVRLVYGQFVLRALPGQAGQVVTHPYVRPPRQGQPAPPGVFSMEHPVSECEVRAATHVAALLGPARPVSAMLAADVDTVTVVDGNFVSFGGRGSNYKTADLLASPANVFIDTTFTGFSLKSGEELPFECANGVDHGFILRLTPLDFPGRSWIVCAGIGEWGTSGAAWFLAHRWRMLAKRVHPLAYYAGAHSIPDFLAIVKVLAGQDQSASLQRLYRRAGLRVKRVL